MVPPHIISWADDERSASPVSTTTASLVSIESITSDSVSETQSRFKSMSFPVFLGKRESGAHLANDDPFTRHDKYYFNDGNITFLVRPCYIVQIIAHGSTKG
jgi:hypothetical protein